MHKKISVKFKFESIIFSDTYSQPFSFDIDQNITLFFNLVVRQLKNFPHYGRQIILFWLLLYLILCSLYYSTNNLQISSRIETVGK